MNKTTQVLGCALLALAAAACGGSDGAGGWAGTQRDSAGVTIVDNPMDGLWEGDRGWEVEEVFRVGGMDGDTEAELGMVVGVDVDDAGRVYVADQQARHVQVFDVDGSFLRTLGGPGEGPGEFGPGLAGVFVHGDTVRVPDVTNERINRFGSDGTLLPSQRISLADGIPLRWDETGDGELVTQRRGMQLEGMAALADGDPIATIPSEGEEPRLLATVPRGRSFEISQGNASLKIFEPEPTWDLANDGVVAQAMNDTYRVELWRDGSLARVVTRPVEPVEVTDGEERRIRDMTRDMMVSTGAPEEAVAMILERMEFGETYPVFAQLLLSGDGTLWVQRIRTSRDVPEGVEWSPQDMGSNEWDVFDTDGRYLGVLAFPLRFQPMREVDGVVWGVERDDFDVQSVVGYRVSTGG